MDKDNNTTTIVEGNGSQEEHRLTRTALQNAASISSLMLTTEAMICEIPEKKPAPASTDLA